MLRHIFAFPELVLFMTYDLIDAIHMHLNFSVRYLQSQSFDNYHQFLLPRILDKFRSKQKLCVTSWHML